MTPRSPQSGIPPVLRKPPIAEELNKLRELPPRTTNREPLSRLERLAILNGLRGGTGAARGELALDTRPGLTAAAQAYRQQDAQGGSASDAQYRSPVP